MTWHIDGVGGGGGRIATEFWKNTNIGLKGGWIDAALSDPKKKRIGDIERNEYGYYIFTRAIADLEDTIKSVTGQRIDIDGYNRRPELPMTALSIEKVRNKIVSGIADKIFKNDLIPDGDYESILFTVAFGGGTGTGIINPVSEILRERTGAAIYALGVLPGSEDIKDFPLPLRCFNTSWALRNLLIKTHRKGVDAVFLADNEVLGREAVQQKSGFFSRVSILVKIIKNLKDYRSLSAKSNNGTTSNEEKNRRIFESLFPMMNPRKLDEGFTGTDLRAKLTAGISISMPQVFVPCYYSTNNNMKVRELLERAVENKMMDCDHTKADSVIVFTSLRGLEEKEEIVEWVKSNITKYDKNSDEEISVCRVWNPREREVLMLLRNPYGGGEEDPFYKRLSAIINNAIEYATSKSSEEKVNPDILEGFNKDVRTKLSDFIIERLIPDLKK